MEFQRLMEIGECPIMYPGGGFGLVIRWDDTRNEIGIQLPGADDIKWIHASEITEYGVGALAVTGRKPVAPNKACTGRLELVRGDDQAMDKRRSPAQQVDEADR